MLYYSPVEANASFNNAKCASQNSVEFTVYDVAKALFYSYRRSKLERPYNNLSLFCKPSLKPFKT